ncbi:hypothetical protein MBLNU457_3228t1 [Dothideomycetes sp. NU457]
MDYKSANIPAEVLPDQPQIEKARNTIKTSLSDKGIGVERTEAHLRKDITQGLSNSSKSSRYYGFVTGGATPAAQAADNVVTEFDQNVQVHLPTETIATDVEFHTLNMLCELINLDPRQWTHKTFTTGATASNNMGLACGREHVLQKKAMEQGMSISVAEDGLLEFARVARVQILTTVPHSSIRKAASIVGLGHKSVVDCSVESVPYKFDMVKLENALSTPSTASIVMISCSEVNTGMFGTESRQEMAEIRRLADAYGAWIHIDAAFGFMARLLPATEDFSRVRKGAEGLELADSITGDGHKMLNVPYDTGFFLSKHLDIGTQVFQNPNAVYLSAGASAIPSPLNIGLDNSRRFRALPVYANLIAYGRSGYADMIERQVTLARMIANYLHASSDYDVYEPSPNMSREDVLSSVFVIVLFRAVDTSINEKLVNSIKETRKIYCSGTQWQGLPAARFAISNWKCDPARDFVVVKDVLDGIARN